MTNSTSISRELSRVAVAVVEFRQAVGPDGKAAKVESRKIAVFDVASGKELAAFPGTTNQLGRRASLALSPGGDRLAYDALRDHPSDDPETAPIPVLAVPVTSPRRRAGLSYAVTRRELWARIVLVLALAAIAYVVPAVNGFSDAAAGSLSAYMI